MTAQEKYVVFDTENNGLFDYKTPADADGQPRLASACFIEADADGNEIARKNFYVRPDGWSMTDLDHKAKPGGKTASEVNGLNDDILQERGVPVSDVLDVWEAYLNQGMIFAAYNAQHDLKQLRAEMRRDGRDDRFIETPNTCLMRAMKAYKGQDIALNNFGTCKLAVACEFFGRTDFDWHDAESDTEAALFVMQNLIRDGNLIEPKVHFAKTPPEPKAASDTTPKDEAPKENSDISLAGGGLTLETMFSAKDGEGNSILMKRIDALEKDLLKETFSTETDKARKRIASVAYSVAKTKTAVDKAGKDLGEEARKALKAINENRNAAKDRLQEIQDKVRAPLVVWEKAEEERKIRVAEQMARIDVSSVTSDMDPFLIAERIQEAQGIDPKDEFWGDRSAEAEVSRDACLAEWPTILGQANQRVADAKELEDLRAAKARADEDARIAHEEERQAARIREERVARLGQVFVVDEVMASEASVSMLQSVLERVAAIDVTESSWGDLAEQAFDKKTAATSRLAQLIAEAEAREAKEEAERVKQVMADQEAAREAEAARLAQEEAERATAAKRAEEEAERAAKEKAENRDRIIKEIADAIDAANLLDSTSIAGAIFDGGIPHVTISGQNLGC